MYEITIKITNYFKLPQEIPVNTHKNLLKVNQNNSRMQVLHLECQWKPHKGIVEGLSCLELVCRILAQSA